MQLVYSVRGHDSSQPHLAVHVHPADHEIIWPRNFNCVGEFQHLNRVRRRPSEVRVILQEVSRGAVEVHRVAARNVAARGSSVCCDSAGCHSLTATGASDGVTNVGGRAISIIDTASKSESLRGSSVVYGVIKGESA